MLNLRFSWGASSSDVTRKSLMDKFSMRMFKGNGFEEEDNFKEWQLS